jgi:sulfite exporter TauE/SafE/copper chaperone CopZ
MSSDIKNVKLRIGGMTCTNCEDAIRKKLLKTDGVKKVDASYVAGTASITYDANKVTIEKISKLINDTGYEALGEAVNDKPKFDVSRTLGLLIIIAAVYLVLEGFGILRYLVPQELGEGVDMSYWLALVVGLTTSVHCIAMCGGINISQCLRKGGADRSGWFSVLQPSILYNAGRVASYTAIGFIVGWVGSKIEFSSTGKGVLMLIAGGFMILMGVNMLNLFPQLRRFMPRMPKALANAGEGKGPLAVGLLNGLMPCGPLLSMQAFALGTGNPFKGALIMALFALGTVPLMFGLGAASTTVGKKFSQKVMAGGAVIVAVMGLCMLSYSWSMFGFGTAYAQGKGNDNSTVNSGLTGINLGPQVINSTLQPFAYPSIKVEAGRPVKWIIDAQPGTINGCNSPVVIREYGIEHRFQPGENIIEFTPNRVGTVPFSCWMGMIKATITVVSQGSGAGEVPAPPGSGGRKKCCG